MGYKIISVQESTEVFDKVKEVQPDLIIMDIMMPGESGDKIASRLKAFPKTRNIPIILITADILTDEKKVNVDYFIRRPVIGDNLIKILDDIFKKKNHV
jgi:CheY-like chemotaxis protein